MQLISTTYIGGTMALILLNSRGMRTILYVCGMTLSLCTLAPAAMADDGGGCQLRGR